MSDNPLEGIAVIGMSACLPGSPDLRQFWDNLCAGRELLTRFTREQCAAAGVPDSLLDDPDYVRVAGAIEGADQFDAGFFGISTAEALLIDPQQRLFLEHAWRALEDAGYGKPDETLVTGVYGGTSLNRYLLFNVMPNLERGFDPFQALLGADKDFLTTRVSYKLNLKGPSLDVQTACSSSLVAVHLACESLLSFETDMALAGGVSLIVPRCSGYRYAPGGILSPTGQCRAFDAAAAGTVPGEGVGMVVLKRLEDAVADGDTIRAVIRGTAINNDGADKTAYSAPSIDGQERVIRRALTASGLDATELDFVECHGTGTALGDPIEVEALRRALCEGRREPLLLGSLKTNIGHLDAAAGVAGLIKAVLALENSVLPASLHFEKPNPEIDFGNDALRVNTDLQPLAGSHRPLAAAVSSFGMGGTNAHVVLQQAPPVTDTPVGHPPYSFPLSAKTDEALRQHMRNLAGFLKTHPNRPLTDVAHTLRVGRSEFAHAFQVTVQDHKDAVLQLNQAAESATLPRAAPPNVDAPRGRRIPLPTYPFQRKRVWLDVQPKTTTAAPTSETPAPSIIAAAIQTEVTREKQRFAQPGGETQAAMTFWNQVEAHCGAWTGWVLQSMGWQPAVGETITTETLANHLSIGLKQARHLHLLLGILKRDGFLCREPSGWKVLKSLPVKEPFNDLAAWAVAYPNQGVPLGILRRCLENLPAMLRNQRHPLETLAPGGDVSMLHALYRGGPLIESVNRLVAQAFSEITARFGGSKPLRILEIGAGTGATTTGVLPRLKKHAVSYLFTDLSTHFLNRARKRFHDFPFVDYTCLDIEKPLADQGFATQRFDVVLAANVLHATADLPHSLGQAAKLTERDGLLVLLEGTTRSRFADLVFGGLAGWSAFEDGDQRETLQLNADQWLDALQQGAWRDAQFVLPSDTGINIFIARAPHRVESEAKPSAGKPTDSPSSIVAKELPRAAPSSDSVSMTEGQAGPTSIREAENLLAQIWAEVLMCDPPQREDDFFDLGGDSLFALQIVDQIKRKTGKDVSVTQLEEAPTLGEQAALIATSTSGTDLVPLLNNAGQGTPLFLLPGGLGGMDQFTAMIEANNWRRPIMGVNYRPLLSEQSDPVAATAALILNRHKNGNTNQPLLLAGHSLGGWIAYAVAIHLQEQGCPPAWLGLFDIHALGSRFETEHIDRTKGQDGATMKRLDQVLNGTADDPGFSTLGAFIPNTPARFPITLFKAVDDPPRNAYGMVPDELSHDPTYGWRRLTTSISVEEISGGHLSMFQNPHAAGLANKLAMAIRRHTE